MSGNATPDDGHDLGRFTEGDDSASITRRGASVLGRGIAEQRTLFYVAVFFSILYGAMTVADAWVLGWATDNVIRPSYADGDIWTAGVWAGALAFISVALLRSLGVVGRRLVGGIVYFRLVADYRRRVTRKYLDLPLSWHNVQPTGRLLSNANADVEATWAVFQPLPMAIGVAAMLLAALGSMLAADPVLTLVGLIVFPALFGINVVYQRWQAPRMARAQSLRGTVSAVAHESFDGALVVKSLGREDDETERFAEVSARLRDANIGVGRVRSVFDPVLDALPNIGILLVLLVGAARVSAGDTNPGDVVQVAFLFTVVAFPVRAIGWVLAELPRAVIGSDRVQSVLEADATVEYGEAELRHDGQVGLDVDHVTFAFHDSPEDPVLCDVDFDVAPGSVTAIVGATGSGKSTLASLLVRLVDPQRGRIKLDGDVDVDVRDLTHESLAGTVALVPQGTFMFDDTIRENVALGEDLSDHEIWEALRSVQAEQFVSALPDGLDSRLGERGTSLSGGQRQRLALARALVRNPAVLVLDDATSAVDPQVERQILSALAERTEDGHGPTVVVVAYRKATIALADEVVYLSDGRIVDRAPHSDLHARNAGYRSLVDAYDHARVEVDHE